MVRSLIAARGFHRLSTLGEDLPLSGSKPPPARGSTLPTTGSASRVRICPSEGASPTPQRERTGSHVGHGGTERLWISAVTSSHRISGATAMRLGCDNLATIDGGPNYRCWPRFTFQRPHIVGRFSSHPRGPSGRSDRCKVKRTKNSGLSLRSLSTLYL